MSMPGVSRSSAPTVLPFAAEGFLLSFSLPNFFVHATTTDDLLRMKDMPPGKRDVLGRMRMNT